MRNLKKLNKLKRAMYGGIKEYVKEFERLYPICAKVSFEKGRCVIHAEIIQHAIVILSSQFRVKIMNLYTLKEYWVDHCYITEHNMFDK